MTPSTMQRTGRSSDRKLRAFSGAGCRRARGQAMVLAVVCMIVFCVGLLVLFNTGIVVNKKVQLNNAADAAAYSAAVQQARAYNLIAYLNRAEVANEIAISQMVSIHSWMNYTISATDHFADAINGVGYVLDIIGVGEELNLLAQELQEAKQFMEEGRDGMQKVFDIGISLMSEANVLYGGAQRAMADAEIGDIPLLAQSVITANTRQADDNTDREAQSLSTLGGAGLLTLQAEQANKSFVRLYQIPAARSPGSNPAPTADADRLNNIVMQERDDFTRERVGSIFGVINRKGGTDLVHYKRWVALDDLDLQFPMPFPLKDFDVPFAWAGAAAVTSNTGGGFANLVDNNPGWTSPYDGWRDNPYDGALNDNGKSGGQARKSPAEPDANDAILVKYQGLQSYEDVANKTYAVKSYQDSDDDGGSSVGPIFTVFVTQRDTDITTSSQIPGMAGQDEMKAPDQYNNNRMSALSSAQVYFDRPRSLFPRADGKRELGSLFSPYWQARLVDTPNKTRLEIAAADAL